MRLSMMLAGGGGMTVRDMVDLSVRGERAGLDGVYLPEAWRSGFVALTAIAAATSRIRLGPYVLNAHARTPWIAGMSAVDLDELSGGRLVLGVGSGNRVTNEQYQGVPVVRPLEKMRDYVTVLRRVTQARLGERVDQPGTRHSTTGWHSQVEPVRSAIPIMVAATSPRMTSLAAEIADGIALGSLQSARFIADLAARCRGTARADFQVMASTFIAVDDDRDAARRAARRAVVNLYAGKPHPHYDSLLRQQGYDAVADGIAAAVRAGDLEAADAAVSDDVVDELTVAGTPDDCRSRLEEYQGTVDDLVLVNVSGMRYQAGASAAAGSRQAMQESFDPLLDFVADLNGARTGA